MSFEIGLGFYEIINGGRFLGCCNLYPNQRLDLCVKTVGHEIKLAIRRNEGDGFIVIEGSQTDTLVEMNVFQIDVVAVLVGLKFVISHIETDLVVQA